MAVAATRSDTLTLGISYQGSQTCFRADWKISRIALKLREMTDPYFVTINTALPTEQLLTFSQETTPDDEIKLLNNLSFGLFRQQSTCFFPLLSIVTKASLADGYMLQSR